MESREYLQLLGVGATTLAFCALSISELFAPAISVSEAQKRFIDTVQSSDPRVIVLDPWKDREEAIEIATRSFNGTEATAPEGNLDWALGPELSSKWSDPKRVSVIRWVMSWSFDKAAHFGVCFGIRDPSTGKLDAVAMTMHPGSTHKGIIHEGIEMFLGIVRNGAPPWQSKEYSKTVDKRVNELGKIMPAAHKKMAPTDHWFASSLALFRHDKLALDCATVLEGAGLDRYLMVLAVDPKSQGQGAGGALLRHLNTLADTHNVPIYLETSGSRNAGIYHRKGYTMREDFKMEEGGASQTFITMLRPAKAR